MQKIKSSGLIRKSVTEFKESEKTPLIIVLDNVRSALNAGSVFRTADAFLIEAIYLCGITATPPHREIQKTALGATETVRWKYFKQCSDAISELKKMNYKIISAEHTTTSVSLNDFIPGEAEKIAVVLGNEVSGVEQHIISQSDMCIEIPQFGTKHSLNISVSAGIVMWDLFLKMRKMLACR